MASVTDIPAFGFFFVANPVSVPPYTLNQVAELSVKANHGRLVYGILWD
jgi:hypothetical protein